MPYEHQKPVELAGYSEKIELQETVSKYQLCTSCDKVSVNCGYLGAGFKDGFTLVEAARNTNFEISSVWLLTQSSFRVEK